MWQRFRSWCVVIAFIGVALAIYFEPSHCVRGWLRGEAFYNGRPTSYWREELERWDFDVGPDGNIEIRSRRPSWIERARERWWRKKEDLHQEDLFPGIYFFGNDEEMAVLQGLSNDPCPRIREFACQSRQTSNR